MGVYLIVGYVVLGVSALVCLFVGSIFVRMILSGIRAKRLHEELHRGDKAPASGKLFVKPVEEVRSAPASGNLFVHKDEGNPYAFERRWFK